MRPLHLGIGLSVVVHGLAVAFAVTHPPARRVPSAVPAEPPLALVEVAPIDIVYLPAPAEMAPRSHRPSAAEVTGVSPRTVSRTPVPRAPSSEVPGSEGTPPTSPSTAAPAPARPNPLAMRTGPERPEPSYAAAYDLPPAAGAPPPETPISGHLRPVGGGRMESDQGAFTVRVAEDGSVDIEDAPAADIHVLTVGRVPLPILYGRFDVTDLLMRANGMDPYSARKRKILDETREQRYEMGVAYRQKQYARTPELVRENLEALFASKTDPAELKQALFDMWDESIDTEAPGSESEDAVGAGQRARALILGAIRTHFPADHAHAYTDAELAALNRRRTSKRPFAPYAD